MLAIIGGKDESMNCLFHIIIVTVTFKFRNSYSKFICS